MEIQIELYKHYRGANSFRPSDVVKSVVAIDFVGKTVNWSKVGKLTDSMVVRSEGLNLDDFRGPFRVFAKVSHEAAKILGLSKGEGWFSTDIGTNSF